MTDWDAYSKTLKAQLWGTDRFISAGTHDPNPLWRSKFTGQVIHHPRDAEGNSAWIEYLIDPAFTTAKFVEQRCAGLEKTGTRNAASVTHPRPNA